MLPSIPLALLGALAGGDIDMDAITALAAVLASGGDFQIGPGIVPPASVCLPDSGLTELSGCLEMTRINAECKKRETYDEKLECACIQGLINAYHDCQSDIHKCVQMAEWDDWFDQQAKDWHSVCDPFLATRSPTTITTPPEPTLTATYNKDDCYRLAASCYSADYETNKCSRSWLPVSSVSFVSCACQKPIYSLMSECMYNGNVTCKHEPAREEDVLGYRECSYFWTGSETLPPVDMTSFLSLTDVGAGLQATAAAARLQAVSNTADPTARKTWTTAVVPTKKPQKQDYLADL